MNTTELIYSVTDFVAICNQVLDVSFGTIKISGEVSQFKISKNKWVYFDLKDEHSIIRFFGSVYCLSSPIQDGMNLIVRGMPQMHPKYGFSINIQAIQLSGEGTIKKAKDLLEQKLAKEGLFLPERKRTLPYPPNSIGLITSSESAAFADFIKIIKERWPAINIELYDVQVQGDLAQEQIIKAIEYFNTHSAKLNDVVVIIRGGGSSEDLQAFNSEQVTRAVSASRIPTLVAIGHETDDSLAEKVADRRASTPSNAGELLVPDKKHSLQNLKISNEHIHQIIEQKIINAKIILNNQTIKLSQIIKNKIDASYKHNMFLLDKIELLNPLNILNRGFAIIRQNERVVKQASDFFAKEPFEIQFKDGTKKVNSYE